MEIKGNYVLIGVFTILGILGALGLFVWLASVQIDRRFQLYDIYFESVSGLGRAADVRYNGLTVGQVISLELAEDDPRILVRIEIAADTPVRAGTVAQLATQGVTGVSYVSLSGGESDEPLLAAVSDQAIPVIPSEPSLVQTLTETAPDLVAEAVNLITELQGFAGPENQQRVATLLENLSRSSGALDQALSDFSQISQTVATATDQITDFTSRLDSIGAAVESTLAAIDETLVSARSTIAEAERTLVVAADTLKTTESTVGLVGETIEAEVPRLSDDLSAAIRSVDAAIGEAMEQLASVTGRFGSTADLADARLTELGATLAALDTTLLDAQESFQAVYDASDAVEVLVEGTGTGLVEDARGTLTAVDETLAALNETVTEDVPMIAADIREATASAARAVASVEELIENVPGWIDPLAAAAEVTLATATATLGRSSETLARLDGTLGSVEDALAAAATTFNSATTILDEQAAPAAASIRDAASSIEGTMAALTEDLPEIAEDLRQTAARARQVADTVEQAASAAAPGIVEFGRRGLPEFTRFAREAQDLVTQLERLVSRIDREFLR